MKNLILFFALIISFSATSQEVIQTIENQGDTLYFQRTETLTLLPDGTSYVSSINRLLLGDATAAANFVQNAAVNIQLENARILQQAFNRQNNSRQFTDYRTLYASLTGGELFSVIGEQYADFYVTVDTTMNHWRVLDPVNGNFFATITKATNGRYRLRQLSGINGSLTGANWVLNPYSNQNFQLTNYFGTTYNFTFDPVSQNWYPDQRVSGVSGTLRIVKID